MEDVLPGRFPGKGQPQAKQETAALKGGTDYKKEIGANDSSFDTDGPESQATNTAI